jgi:hypothetical protein
MSALRPSESSMWAISYTKGCLQPMGGAFMSRYRGKAGRISSSHSEHYLMGR